MTLAVVASLAPERSRERAHLVQRSSESPAPSTAAACVWSPSQCRRGWQGVRDIPCSRPDRPDARLQHLVWLDAASSQALKRVRGESRFISARRAATVLVGYEEATWAQRASVRRLGWLGGATDRSPPAAPHAGRR